MSNYNPGLWMDIQCMYQSDVYIHVFAQTSSCSPKGTQRKQWDTHIQSHQSINTASDMENKADVKAISARFNTGGSSMDSVPGGRPKVSVHPTFSSGPPTQPKKSALEMSLSGGAATSASTPKPNYLKSTASTKSAPEVQEFPKPKPLVSKFGSPQDEGKPPICKPKPPESLRDTVHKLPLQKLSLSATVTESKPAFSKLPPAVAKPPWIKEGPKSEDGGGSSRSTPPKMPLAPKPKSWSQTEQGNTEDSAVRPFPASPLKPSGIQAAQSIFNQESANTQEKGMKDRVKAFNSHDFSGPKPSVAHKPSFVKKHLEQKENNNPSAPKRSLLPNKLALGTAPAKPNRPPIVTLEKFKKGAEPMTNGPGLKKGSSPLPPASHLSNHVAPPLPSHPGVPCLPPRPSGAIIQPDPDENYDDVVLNNPPPLPSGGHPSQIDEDSGSDGEMYEDLDDRWVIKPGSGLYHKKDGTL
ncbi:hypothetical protein AAFF_G00047100 [Aldrovandia affinis]|uniref:Uncharacterized protein n=1 Tax=Aldrovandia affinis TaxID=143900 RepID=A0AAD7WEY0_9TELE|nr:hypothetical protein AAFF_G00047100 [Aldrovandia affinis]